jgi:hypothetical protein
MAIPQNQAALQISGYIHLIAVVLLAIRGAASPVPEEGNCSQTVSLSKWALRLISRSGILLGRRPCVVYRKKSSVVVSPVLTFSTRISPSGDILFVLQPSWAERIGRCWLVAAHVFASGSTLDSHPSPQGNKMSGEKHHRITVVASRDSNPCFSLERALTSPALALA